MLLLTGERPRWPNLGIEVNVDFVKVQSDLARSEVVDQPLNHSQAPVPNFFLFTPREFMPPLNDLCLNQGGAPSTGVLDDTT